MPLLINSSKKYIYIYTHICKKNSQKWNYWIWNLDILTPKEHNVKKKKIKNATEFQYLLDANCGFFILLNEFRNGKYNMDTL